MDEAVSDRVRWWVAAIVVLIEEFIFGKFGEYQ